MKEPALFVGGPWHGRKLNVNYQFPPIYAEKSQPEMRTWSQDLPDEPEDFDLVEYRYTSVVFFGRVKKFYVVAGATPEEIGEALWDLIDSQTPKKQTKENTRKCEGFGCNNDATQNTECGWLCERCVNIAEDSGAI